LRRHVRRPGLQTRCARTAGPDIPAGRAAAAAAAKSAAASPLARSVQTMAAINAEVNAIQARTEHLIAETKAKQKR